VPMERCGPSHMTSRAFVRWLHRLMLLQSPLALAFANHDSWRLGKESLRAAAHCAESGSTIGASKKKANITNFGGTAHCAESRLISAKA
jgi:hypothetical protein